MKYSDSDLNIIFEDNHLICVEKPFGLLTQPTEGSSEDLETLTKIYLQKKYQKPKAFLSPIHRLDKAVGGLVLFAKTSKALSRMNEKMRNQEIIREYRAVVEGELEPKQATLSHYLVKLEHKAKVFDQPKPGAKLAELEYRCKRSNSKASEMIINLITGRYHQIRAQFSHIGHPIIGDEKYHSKITCTHICLFAKALTFKHPVTQKKISLNIKIPDRFYPKIFIPVK